MVRMKAGAKDRAEEILLRTIEEYINRGEPVSSRFLFKEYDFGIKPAMIRSELSRLEREGWLSQPHTSGGRIPTDKAYEFYASRLCKQISPGEVPKTFSELVHSLFERQFKEFIENFSNEVHALSVGFALEEHGVWKSGLDELMSRLDSDEANVYKGIARDFESIDDRLYGMAKGLMKHEGLEVHIGEKNPFMSSEHLSTVFDTFDIDGDKWLLIAIGPKRMNYENNLKAFSRLRRAFENK